MPRSKHSPHSNCHITRLLTAILAACCSAASAPAQTNPDAGIHKIKHVIVIMQENRSFDHYFGTFPGADGLPMQNGIPSVCLPDPAGKTCARSFEEHQDRNGGAPHSSIAAARAIDGGKMDGFIAVASGVKSQCRSATDPNCNEGGGAGPERVMAYHVQSDIPNYWAYAKTYVLNDRMFEPVASWSLASHLYMVSGWSANCTDPNDPDTCRSDLARKKPKPDIDTPYGWTDLTWLLNRNHVSWAYYLDGGPMHPGRNPSDRHSVNRGVPEIWNVLPQFKDVHQDNQVNNVQTLDAFYAQLKAGTLPSVSWITPNSRDSEHPPSLVSVGRPTSRTSSTRSCKARSGPRPPSFSPGTTGAASTTTSRRPASISSATASAYPASSSAPTPDAASSITRPSASTPTLSSLKTTSCTAPASTPKPTAAPTPGPTSAKTPRSSAT